MKTSRALLTAVVLSLFVGMLGGSTPALAGTSTVVIPISGTVVGSPESVYLAGLVRITSTAAMDSTSGLPLGVTLFIEFLNVSGLGLSTGTTYVAPGQNNIIRPLVASDSIQIPFPFYPSASEGYLSARSGVASFDITYDISTGAIKGATVAAVSSPAF